MRNHLGVKFNNRGDIFRSCVSNMQYILTSIKPTIACFGTSFKSVIDARNYATSLQQSYGLCIKYNIMCYDHGKTRLVYKSEGDEVLEPDK